MAFTVTRETLSDSDRLTVVHCWLASDAASDVTNQLLVDATDYERAALLKRALVKVQYGLMGFSVALYWDGNPNKGICVLPENAEGCVGFSHHTMGGFPSLVLEPTGDILFSTIGAGATDIGFLVLTIEKRTKVDFTP